MIFPIGDDQVKGGYFPLLSYSFIAINVLVFLYQASLSGPAFEHFVYTYGSIPRETIQGQDLFTLFTSMFLHGSWMHLIGNMVFLWIFADNIEATIGTRRFLVFYILGGLAAHLGHIYFNMGSGVPTVGASGAISGVMGAYLVMFPTSRIKMLILVFFVRIPAYIFLGFWIFQQVTLGNQSLQAVAADTGGVAWWAHIAGFVFGVIGGFYYRLNYSPTAVAVEEARPYDRDDLL
ncbi:MAG: rhomboid family intramembrane serine protease [Bacteroidota bacterium]